MGFKWIISPQSLVEEIIPEKRLWKKLLSGIIVFSVTLATLSLSAILFIHEKIDARFGLNGFEDITPPLTGDIDLIFREAAYIGIALAAIFIILRFMVHFTEAENPRAKALMIMALHSFIVVLLVSILASSIIMTQPKTNYLAVEATLSGVEFYNASFSGISNRREVSFSSDFIRVDQLTVYRVYANKTRVNWNPAYSREEAEKLLEETLTVMNMSSVTWIENEGEENLDEVYFVSGRWKKLDYEEGINVKWIRLGAGISELVLGVLSPIAWSLTALYNVIGFRRMYNASTILSILTWMFIIFVFFLTGII